MSEARFADAGRRGHERGATRTLVDALVEERLEIVELAGAAHARGRSPEERLLAVALGAAVQEMTRGRALDVEAGGQEPRAHVVELDRAARGAAREGRGLVDRVADDAVARELAAPGGHDDGRRRHERADAERAERRAGREIGGRPGDEPRRRERHRDRAVAQHGERGPEPRGELREPVLGRARAAISTVGSSAGSRIRRGSPRRAPEERARAARRRPRRRAARSP